MTELWERKNAWNDGFGDGCLERDFSFKYPENLIPHYLSGLAIAKEAGGLPFPYLDEKLANSLDQKRRENIGLTPEPKDKG